MPDLGLPTWVSVQGPCVMGMGEQDQPTKFGPGEFIPPFNPRYFIYWLLDVGSLSTIGS